MRRNLIYILIVMTLLTTLSGVVVARYISTMDPKTGTLSTPVYFFRSNALTETGGRYTVNGKYTELLLTNGAGSDEYSNIDIEYTVYYSVQTASGAWVRVLDEDFTFSGDEYQKRTITVAPIVYDSLVGSEICNTVLVEAVSRTPYEKTLSAVFTFNYSGYESAVSYDGGVITLVIRTNSDSGAFTLGWTDGITPDNSDPNRILTGVTSGMRSVGATLSEGTIYELKFFVTDAGLLGRLESGEASAESIVTVSR